MRPGQAAPVFGGRDEGDDACGRASMRPGQAAPVFSELRADLRNSLGSLQ